MLKVLKQSFPVKYSPWRVVVLSSFTVFFLLTIFQPFGLSNLGTEKWFRIIGFTGVTAFSTSVVTLLFPFIFKRYYSIEKWTIGKYLFNTALIVLFIGIGNFTFDWNITNRPSETFWNVCFSYFIITFLVGIVPITVITFLSQNYILSHNLREARLLNQQLLDKPDNVDMLYSKQEMILLTGTTKESLSLSPYNILYLEASGNYVKVTYLEGNEIVKTILLRTTISLLEETLKPYPIIQRCHRAFLVNISYITNVQGNMQGFSLDLKHINNEIPVSRTYAKRIKTILA